MTKAIARYLGIGVSAEGHLKNRKGIAIILHGTPVSGLWQLGGVAPLWGKACTCHFEDIRVFLGGVLFCFLVLGVGCFFFGNLYIKGLSPNCLIANLRDTRIREKAEMPHF